MKLAVASYSLHQMVYDGKLDVFGYLNMIKHDFRVDYADIWSGMLPTLDEAFIQKIREEMDRLGLKLANLCVDGPHVWMADPEQRASHKAQMLEYIRAGRQLGAESIRIDFGGRDEEMTDEALEYLIATYKEYCELCGQFGCKIGPETHWGWDRVPEYIRKVRDGVNSPWYGILYHIDNLADIEEGEELCLDHCMHTHFPARSITTKAKEIACRLIKKGYTGAFSVEHHSGQLEVERTHWQLASLREIMAEIAVEGVDTQEKAYMSQLYAGERRT